MRRWTVLICTSLLLGGGGCFDPQYGDVAFTCSDDKECPAGYQCVPWQGAKVCLREGASLPDAGSDLPVQQDGPAVPKDGLKKDGPTVKPDGPTVKPDGPTVKPDQGPSPDMPAVKRDLGSTPAPSVTLVAPKHNTTDYGRDLTFKFTVKSAAQVSSCTLYVDNAKRRVFGQVTADDKTVYSWTYQDIADGKHTWYVICSAPSGQSNKVTYTVTSASYVVSACKSTWSKNTKYKLTGTFIASATTGSCLKITASGVLLDGNNFAMRGNNFKDVVRHYHKSTSYQVLNNVVNTAPSGSSPFSSGQSISGNSAAVGDIAVGDLDNNGSLDLVLNWSQGAWAGYLNKGNYFYRSSSLAESGEFYASRVVDLSGNGLPEVVVLRGGTAATDSERVYAFNTATQKYSQWISFAAGDRGSDLDLADLDGDGDLDLVVGNRGTNAYERYVVTNNVAKTPPQMTPSTLYNGAIYDEGPTHVGDFNGDGRWDLLVPRGSGSSTSSYVFLNNGKGGMTFSKGIAVTVPMAASDINGDGRSDIVLVQRSSSPRVQIYLSDGSNAPFSGAPKHLLSLRGGQKIDRAFVGDLTGDGRPDLVVTPQSLSQRLDVLVQSSSGTFVANGSTSLPQGVVSTLDMRDMDLDGDVDLLVASDAGYGTNYLTLALGNGKGGFSAPSGYRQTSPFGVNARVVGDMDTAAVGLEVAASNVRVTDLTLRGFAVGVRLPGTAAANTELKNVAVEDPDQVGFQIRGAAGSLLDRCRVTPLHQGTALKFEGAGSSVSRVTIRNSTFCPGTREPHLTPLSAHCAVTVKNFITWSNTSLKQVVGCSLSGAKTCR